MTKEFEVGTRKKTDLMINEDNAQPSLIEKSTRKKIALLIDGDNAQPGLIEKMLAETGKYGQIAIRRIYGDWTTSNMNGWKDAITNVAFQPMQQFRNTIGKNATDSAMIIDAMDILHSGLVDGFCIVSSDSDYTRLATRIRENGIFVIVIGEQKTPKSFVKACDLFIRTENLAPNESVLKEKTMSPSIPIKDVKSKKLDIPLLKEAFEMAVRDDGWSHLGEFGNRLLQLDPGFDPRTYGYKQLSQLIKAYPKERKKQSLHWQEKFSAYYIISW